MAADPGGRIRTPVCRTDEDKAENAEVDEVVGWLRWGLVVCLALALLPSPMDDKLAQAAEQKQWVQEQRKKTEDLVKELETKKLDLTAKNRWTATSRRCKRNWTGPRIRNGLWSSWRKR